MADDPNEGVPQVGYNKVVPDAASTKDCVIWPKAKNRYGYGVAWDPFKGQAVHAHRWMWMQAFGSVPDGLCVLHTCDVRACVHLGHLYLGTKGDNNRDTSGRGRNSEQQKTHCILGHPYSGENLTIRKNGKRVCRACRSIRNRRDIADKDSRGLTARGTPRIYNKRVTNG